MGRRSELMGKGSYVKGAGRERELKHILEEKGYYVLRSGKSGVDGYSPDLIALRTTNKMAIECKAIENNNLYLEKNKVEIYRGWEKITGLPVYVAWRRNRKDWKLFPLNMLKELGQSYVISEDDYNIGIGLENF